MLFSKEECHFFKVYKHAKQSYEVFIGTNVCKKQTKKKNTKAHMRTMNPKYRRVGTQGKGQKWVQRAPLRSVKFVLKKEKRLEGKA